MILKNIQNNESYKGWFILLLSIIIIFFILLAYNGAKDMFFKKKMTEIDMCHIFGGDVKRIQKDSEGIFFEGQCINIETEKECAILQSIINLYIDQPQYFRLNTPEKIKQYIKKHGYYSFDSSIWDGVCTIWHEDYLKAYLSEDL